MRHAHAERVSVVVGKRDEQIIVVIEEDGKTEEEFVEELSEMNKAFRIASEEANRLSLLISENVQKLCGLCHQR